MELKTMFEDVPAWPGKEPQPAQAVIGHNKPPLSEIIPVEFRAGLQEKHPTFIKTLDNAVAAAARAKAEDDETLGKCGDLVVLYRRLISHVEATHKVLKAPHLEAGRLVDAEKNALITRLEDAKRTVEAKGNAFVAKRNARIEAEEAARAAEARAAADRAALAEQAAKDVERRTQEALQAAETHEDREIIAEQGEAAQEEAQAAMEDAALAAGPVRKAEPVRSDAGAAVSGKRVYQSAIDDYALAFKEVSDDPKVREAIEKAVQRLVKAGKRELLGCRIWPVSKANFR